VKDGDPMVNLLDGAAQALAPTIDAAEALERPLARPQAPGGLALALAPERGRAVPVALAAPFVAWIAQVHEQAGVVDAGQFRGGALRSLLEAFEGCEAIWGTDGGVALRVAARGREDSGLAARWPEVPDFASDCIAWRVRDPLSGLTTGIVIRRGPGRGRAGAPFDAQDLAALRLAVSHLLLAWRTCQTLKLYRRATAAGDASAIVDRDGHLQVADHRFLGAVRRCWPHWSGARVPDPLRALLAGGAPVIAADLRWSVVEEGDLRFLTAGAIGVLARLTGREREAALALLAGQPYAECARQLGISVNTLRNTIARVYRKLGVAGKLELAQRAGFVVPAAH
jgi:DNA-binding CsgD family transcriptional regulator